MDKRDECKRTADEASKQIYDDSKTRVSPVPWEQHGRNLLTGHAGSGVQAAWLLSGLSYGTWEPGRWC